jgi:hypothetical protein
VTRGYIYTIDAAVAILIIIVALIPLFATQFYAPQSTDANALTNDIIQLLTETRMSDVCDSTCGCVNVELQRLCVLPNFNREAPLSAAFGEAFFRGHDDDVEDAIEAILRESGAVPESHGIQVILTDETGTEYLLYGDPV